MSSVLNNQYHELSFLRGRCWNMKTLCVFLSILPSMARQVLRACDVEFETYDVLSNQGVREAIKVRNATHQRDSVAVL